VGEVEGTGLARRARWRRQKGEGGGSAPSQRVAPARARRPWAGGVGSLVWPLKQGSEEIV
jgi:hypothetical protein